VISTYNYVINAMVIKKNQLLRIVGAGPGDPELISVKGAMALQEAEVVLYDALVNEQLLDAYVQDSSKRVFVGKRKGKHEFSQEEINDLLFFYGSKFKNVVRLKGGDPFVFGRGHEEVEYLTKKGINVEVVPGISSAIAAPSAAGIPLTKRGVCESFWVVTGTTASGELSSDLFHAAHSTATVIVLMGISKIEKIAAIFKNFRSEDEPMAVIQYATWPEQKIISGTVSNIQRLMNEYNVGYPGVIVIGKVVNERIVSKAIASASSIIA
jgi:uroporphyrin-III C-methyltransferase